MFKIESYVTPILLSYVDKYVRDFKPADAQVSLWGGGVALHNLVLKADVLQQEVALPFTLVSGRIHELLIQVPWTKIMSEPIVVTINTIECVLSLHPPPPPDEIPPPECPSRRTQVVEAPPGYMQALVRRIVSNIALRVHHLIVKYVQDDIVLSLNIKHLAVDSAGADWTPAFADIDQNHPVIRRLVRLDDLTLCLDRADSDGKIRFYQEPLLYRCHLDLRVLTRLVSASTRRASSVGVQLRSSRLAWGVTGDQLTLLLRLLRERGPPEPAKSPPPVHNTKTSALNQSAPMHVTSANSAEPARSESWSEWAWSWLPTWMDKDGGVDETPMPATPTPVHFSAYLDDVSIVFKVMEVESGGRRRARGVLEARARHAAARTQLCVPTALHVRLGVRGLAVLAQGNCVCGHVDLSASNEEPTIYLRKASNEANEEDWTWPNENFDEQKVELAEAVSEEYTETQDYLSRVPNEEPNTDPAQEHIETSQDGDELWNQMNPIVYLEYTHERSPPNTFTNPYENSPINFEYSDWVESCSMKVHLLPIEVRVCMGLLHRLGAIKTIIQELPPVPLPEVAMRTLTVEECEALSDNLPQRRISLEARAVLVRLLPWDHAAAERAAPAPLLLDVNATDLSVVVTAPLYSHRVCSAACQLPGESGALRAGARLHVVATATLQAGVCGARDRHARPCARAHLRLVAHNLLHPGYFADRETVLFSYNMKIREANVCGSAARLQAAWHIVDSLLSESSSAPLKHTTLTRDALNDEEAVAIDMTLEELTLRGYLTRNINTHILMLHSARATIFHAPNGGELKQAWLFSAPDAPTTSPYLRLAVQWCAECTSNAFDYAGVWMEPTAVCIDPLLIAWLAYRPQPKPIAESASQSVSRTMSSTQYFMRRRTTPPGLSQSSSGRGASRSAAGAELVHATRPRSLGSNSEPSDRRDSKRPSDTTKESERWPASERLLRFHERLRRMLVTAETGLTLVYVTPSTASALDCATVRDAMERHAAAAQRVLVLSLGRLSMHSSTMMKHLWNEIRHDGPTFLAPKTDPKQTNEESFPWKLRLADVSCYTLEGRIGTEYSGPEKASSGMRSQLKTPCTAMPRTILELVTTTVTLSVVTKSLHIKTAPIKSEKKHSVPTVEEERVKYFTAGVDFKPSTLKEFIRGPIRRRKTNANQQTEASDVDAVCGARSGPVVSLGVHLHADTPPIIFRLDHDQVHLVAASAHCLSHVFTLLQKAPSNVTRQDYTSLGGSHRSLIRSVSELEEQQNPSDETQSENRSELIPIYEARTAQEDAAKLKTFFWFQWVVSRATLVVATHQVKLAFDVDDIISTVDIQSHYNQLKVKVASASIRHYERRGSEEWSAGALRGRVLEAREPADAREDTHFLAVTVTQAQISNLPASWKEELHPKVLQNKSGTDSMWEVCARLAPLEVLLQPAVLRHAAALARELAPRSYCALDTRLPRRSSTWQWPFCYITAGGLRLIVTSEENQMAVDDTFMLVIGKIAVNPHPDNPICRRPINSGTDSGWLSAGSGFEGRQYDVTVNNVAIHSAQFKQLVNQEASESELLKGTGSENPALKWSQPPVSPALTPVLHAMDIGCILAPALYMGGTPICGPAFELNLLSDCTIELSVDHLSLLQDLTVDMCQAMRDSQEQGMQFNDENHGVCPYASLLLRAAKSEETTTTVPKDIVITDEMTRSSSAIGRSLGADSGVDTVTSHSTIKSSRHFDETQSIKKPMVAFAEETVDASEYIEVFVTMGTIDISLYTADDGSPEVVALRPPQTAKRNTPEPVIQVTLNETKESHQKEDTHESQNDSRSLTETIRNADIDKTKLDMTNVLPHARKCEGNLPLLHLTLYQPNFYYWRRKSQKNLQVSVFNAWAGVGGGEADGHWRAALVRAERGSPDPTTDIPPALATLKLVAPNSGMSYMSSSGSASVRGELRLDIERPVMLEVCTDRLCRLKGVLVLINNKTSSSIDSFEMDNVEVPKLYKLRRFMVEHSIESVTVQTGQMSVSGSEGTVGWEGLSLQVAVGARPERLVTHALVSALLAAAGPPADTRHLLLQPLMAGIELEATWEAWRRAEGGAGAREPSVRALLELDHAVLDLRPADLAALARLRTAVELILDNKQSPQPSAGFRNTIRKPRHIIPDPRSTLVHECHSNASFEATDVGDHYYKDDLRSGAFKLVSGGQLPMAYQVTLRGGAVAWRYPHPRAITRLVAFPLPGQDTEVDCILEVYNTMLERWEPHTKFKLPVSEPRELKLYAAPPDTVFGVMWRFRACSETESELPPYEFNINKFLPRNDPLSSEVGGECEWRSTYDAGSGVSAEQLSGALRVDSYFAPRLMPRLRLALRLVAFEVNAHNDLPSVHSQAASLEGYYVTRPLMRSHRVLTLIARDTTAHAHLGSTAGNLLLFNSHLSSDVLECSTGTMEELTGEVRIQGGLSTSLGASRPLPRLRLCAGIVRVTLHVPRLRTLAALHRDWHAAALQYLRCSSSTSIIEERVKSSPTQVDAINEVAQTLEGRISLWLHNSSAAALRVGQEGTDEVVPLGPGANLAYRWRCPTSPKKLRFALAGPSADWHWSNSVPFTRGACRVRLQDTETLGGSLETPGAGVYLHVSVEEAGARRHMTLAGKLVLVNMLRFNLLYKVRARCSEQKQSRSVCSGELGAETVGRSVLCAADCEMVLKIKFPAHDTGWSGDIPLKECPKENVPWLVKVPSSGSAVYMSVWCRVVRARNDGRALAALWPLYTLHSHLPLDTDVLITTESDLTSSEPSTSTAALPSLVQTAPGRGATIHLLAPGTTSARHSLSFQYRDIECPVTREAVPLHYGVTDTSVFEKRSPAVSVDEVMQDIRNWLERSSRGAMSSWPYSLVASHWPGPWQPALLQPRSDVTVRYSAIKAGGGCSLEVRLCPLVLLCNASPLPLTLRADDTAPLCKLEPGTAISPPSAILTKPFFMSVEVGRETFVSGSLAVWAGVAGRYGAPPAGHVALDRAAHFAIHCNQKVALLTMYYEIKEEINVLGITSTYMLINHLDTDILVSAIVVPHEDEKDTVLQPKTFKVVQPTKDGSVHGAPLARFVLQGRWRGDEAGELRAFLCLALPNDGAYAGRTPVPLRLAAPPLRRAIALHDYRNRSVAVVVTQVRHEGRWVVTVAADPCPQFAVHNLTRTPLAVAQPLGLADEPSTSKTQAAAECPGASWWWVVQPGTMMHYSTPAYCNRYPPLQNSTPQDNTIPFVTFAKYKEEATPEWCAGVATTEGSQLVIVRGATVKLRVRSRPHSTLLLLQDVDQSDISASDIRRRLLEPFLSEDSLILLQDTRDDVSILTATNLERMDALDKLMDRSEPSESSLGQSKGVHHTIDISRSIQDIAVVPECHRDNMKNLSNDSSLIDRTVCTDSQAENKYTSTQNLPSAVTLASVDVVSSETSYTFHEVTEPEWTGTEATWAPSERVRCAVESVALWLAAAADTPPLLALHLDRVSLLMLADSRGTKTTLSVGEVQADNAQYDSGQFDFAVVASTCAAPPPDSWPPLWNMFVEHAAFETRHESARLLLHTRHDSWTVAAQTYNELTEVEVRVGPVALYVEDAYVTAAASLARLALPPTQRVEPLLAEIRALQRPLRLRTLHIHPLDLTLTLHTAVRMYIALDQSPLRLSAFKLQDMMTSAERLTHALTVHYLSAAILGAGWVVGGLELLGAPGALAARVSGAGGGVRGVAAAAAAALLHSLSACAGSLARNLDLLAGDEEHARRAAAARRRAPHSLLAGLLAGVTNFAINILGAVGGLAHHPLVGVAVGETESGATALRRGLLGAVAKPLSATADLVAYAGHGLLRQTGWDPVPQPRTSCDDTGSARTQRSWRRDCVRWTFRLAELSALAACRVLLNAAPLLVIITHKFLVVADPETERIVEMIDLRSCTLGPYQGQIIELRVTQRRQSKIMESRAIDEDDEYQISAAAMARVARYTGAGGAGGATEARTLSLLPAPAQAHALHAALAAAIHHNCDMHFPLL